MVEPEAAVEVEAADIRVVEPAAEVEAADIPVVELVVGVEPLAEARAVEPLAAEVGPACMARMRT